MVQRCGEVNGALEVDEFEDVAVDSLVPEDVFEFEVHVRAVLRVQCVQAERDLPQHLHARLQAGRAVAAQLVLHHLFAFLENQLLHVVPLEVEQK